METVLIITIGILLGFLVFVRPTMGLTIILFSTLFFPEIEVGDIRTMMGVRELTLRPEDFFIILVGIGWFANAVIRSQLPSFIHNPLNIPIMILIFVLIFTTLIGVTQGTTTIDAGFFYTLKRIQYFVVFFLVIGNIKTFKEIKGGISLLLLFSFVVAIWSIIEYLTIGEGRITGPFMRKGQPPILGGFFLIIIFLEVGFFVRYTDLRKRIPILIMITLSFLVIVFTKTRSSYIGLFLGLIIFGIMFKKPSLLVLPVLLIIMMNYLFPPQIVEQMQSIRGVWQRGGKISYAPSWDARIITWRDVIPEITAHPILGKGAGSYSLSWIDNQYVLDLLYTGIIGLTVFIWLIFKIFRSVYPLTKVVRPQDISQLQPDYDYIAALSSGYLGGLVALLIHGMAVTTFYNIRTMIPFWFLTGLVIVAQNIYQKEFYKVES